MMLTLLFFIGIITLNIISIKGSRLIANSNKLSKENAISTIWLIGHFVGVFNMCLLVLISALGGGQ